MPVTYNKIHFTFDMGFEYTVFAYHQVKNTTLLDIFTKGMIFRA